MARRGRKRAAAPTVLVMDEPDSTTEVTPPVNGDAVVKAKRGRTKKEEAPKEKPSSEEVVVKPKGRPRKAAIPVLEAEEEDSDDAALMPKSKSAASPIPEAENGEMEALEKPKSGRGRKATTPVTEVEKTSKETLPKPRGRGRKPATPVSVPDESDVEEPAPAPKKKGRKPADKDAKHSTPVEEVEPVQDEPPAKQKKSSKKSSKTDKMDVDEGTKPTKPKKSASKKKPEEKPVEEESNPDDDIEANEIEEEAAPILEEKPVAAKKGRKPKVAEQKQEVEKQPKEEDDMSDDEVEANGIEEAAPILKEKPVAAKRGRKPKVVEEKEEVEKPAKTEKKVANGKGRKRAAKSDEIDDEEEGEEQAVEEVPKSSKTSKQPKLVTTCYDNFKSTVDKDYNLKISSWNVAGLRAWITKGGLEFIEHEKPDILCLQETKCTDDQLPDEARIAGYHPYWLCKPGGHAGIAIYSKIMPINVEYGIGDSEQDDNGRLMTAEYEKFYVLCVYVPNAGRKLVTMPKRLRWNKIFDEYVAKLNEKKPVIICGDMNVSHREIDLANPKTNKKNAGFTAEEREGMTNLLSLGFVDSFRHLYPDKEKAYTFWSYMGNARSKNVGWRLDYFIVSEKIISKIVDNVIRDEVKGSDHCPITLFANF